MGEVFLGVADRVVDGGGHSLVDAGGLAAVKTLRTDMELDAAFRERFRREIEAARAVRDPRIARLLGGDAGAERPWLATEFVPGPTLHAAVRTCGPLPLPAVLALGRDLAEALRAVHAVGVVHRDLKPANVLLSATGPKLIDFGVARAFGESTLTGTGLMLGTPGFMSPEHIAGSRRVQPASDVFCLASLLCWAATGGTPFDADGESMVAAVLYRISQGDADLTGVPARLLAVLDGCLALRPEERPGLEELLARIGSPGAEVVEWPAGVGELIIAQQARAGRVVAVAADAARAAADAAAAEAAREAESRRTTRLHTTEQPVTPVTDQPTARRVRRARPALIAAAVAFALLAGSGTWWVVNQPEEPGGSSGGGGSPASSGKDTGNRATALASVTGTGGAGATRYFPVVPAQRPDDWKPWSWHLDNPSAGCALNRKVLACRLVDGNLQALDPADGAELWNVQVTGADADKDWAPSIKDSTVRLRGRGGAPVVHGSLVITSEAHSRIRAYDVRDGSKRWDKPLGGKLDGDGENPLTLLDGTVFATTGALDSAGRKLLAFDADTGKPLWKRRIGVTSSIAAASDGVVYLENPLGPIQAVAADSGKTLAERDGGRACGRGLRVSGRQLRCGAGTALDARTLKPIRALNRPDGGYLTQGSPELAWDGGPLLAVRGNIVNTFAAVGARDGRFRWERERDSPEDQDHPPLALVGKRLVLPGQGKVRAGGLSSMTADSALATVDLGKARGGPGYLNGKTSGSVETLSIGGVLFVVDTTGAIWSLGVPK
jgi:hypothetical protein